MEVGDIHFYKERWKAVEEIERQELRAMTLEEHWQKLNALARYGKALGFKDNEDDVEIVRTRWVKIKELYESGAKPSAFRPLKA